MSKITKRQNIGVSDSIVSFMVALAWTTAPVVRVQIRRKFKLTMVKVAVVRDEYRIIGEMHVTVKPGQELYFTKSSGKDGYYYLTSEIGCTCKAGRFGQKCHHVQDVIAYSVLQQGEVLETDPFILHGRAIVVTSGKVA